MEDATAPEGRDLYALSRVGRIAAGALAVLAVPTTAVVAMFGPWYLTVPVVVVAACFADAAWTGRSPDFLEDPLWLAKRLAARRRRDA